MIRLITSVLSCAGAAGAPFTPNAAAPDFEGAFTPNAPAPEAGLGPFSFCTAASRDALMFTRPGFRRSAAL